MSPHSLPSQGLPRSCKPASSSCTGDAPFAGRVIGARRPETPLESELPICVGESCPADSLPMGTDEAFAHEIKGGSDSREQIVKRKLAGGLLPRTKVRKTVWSRGEDNSCDVCELTIASQQVEVEAHLDSSTALRFHTRCFDAWQRACA